ncbi:hypothetical protein ACHAW5_002224 [Stephanodiscus triporus]|uniref:Uncharacterized protein n=1 Tax=Stephanodiscus triporus TaxID=2934178 RepID=A0ABD3N7B0_9STRA
MATSRRTSTSRSTGPCPSLIIAVIVAIVLATTTIATKPTVLRIRTADRGVIRVTLPDDDDPGATTLSSILALAGVDLGDDDLGARGVKCQLGLPGSATLDLSPGGPDVDKTAAELGLEHGSIITILPSTLASSSTNSESGGARGRSRSKDSNDSGGRFDPFPHLAKSALRACRRSRAPSRSVNTYGDISRMQDAMHTVEAQSKGPLARVYVCSVGAARFRNHCCAVNNTSKATENRVALLFGTVNREAVDPNNAKRARTSLSSTTREERMCVVARVHAIWEPPNQKPTLGGMWYDGECLLSTGPASTEDDVVDRDDETSSSRGETPAQRAIRVAGWLGLRPVGWMFSYSHDRNTHADDEGGASLPVHGRDAIMGATLQIERMKCSSREEGRKFVTLALDCRDGAAEAFQLSDTCVQMVAEGVLSVPSPAAVDNGDAPTARGLRMVLGSGEAMI